MAITEIHAIETTPEQALEYIQKDKIGRLRDGIEDGITYIQSDKEGEEEVVYKTLSSYKYCTEKNAIHDFRRCVNRGRGKFRREAPRTKSGNEIMMWHCIQSFEEYVPPEVANVIGQKLAIEVFKDFPVVISTHTNTDHIHNHLMICAWDLNGKKWHDCHASKRLIRQVSDRLCEEYGLNVLYSTQNMNLVKYNDSEGNVHYYEPTDRKNELIRKRELGEISKDDVKSYRNTPAYKDLVERELTSREMVQHDIDSLLPSVLTYEHLLDTLRDLGYQVKDKKKNGDWLAHVTFIPPGKDKGTRDYKIGDGEFYTRENLTKHIENLFNERKTKNVPHREDNVSLNDVTYFEDYECGKTDVSALNEDYRVSNTKEGNFKLVKRGETEKMVIRDIRKNDRELYSLYDTSTIKKVIAAQKGAKNNRKPYKAVKREEILVQRIQESFDNLKFMERKNIYSYQQINHIVRTLWDKYNQCLSQSYKIEKSIERLKEIVELPHQAEIIEDRIDGNKDNLQYMAIEYETDYRQLNAYKDKIVKYKLEDPAEVEHLKAKLVETEQKLNKLNVIITGYGMDLAAYDRCIKILERIDNENDGRNANAINEYKEIRRVDEQTKQTEEQKGKNEKGGRER